MKVLMLSLPECLRSEQVTEEVAYVVIPDVGPLHDFFNALEPCYRYPKADDNGALSGEFGSLCRGHIFEFAGHDTSCLFEALSSHRVHTDHAGASEPSPQACTGMVDLEETR